MTTEPTNQTILIVEDDLPELNALVEQLTREHFKVLRAKNGAEGLLIANRDKPDLILLDILMPVMDGLTMMRRLRTESAWGKTVPIILLTNLSPDDEEINRRLVKDEPAFYLIKTNWSLSEVVQKIKDRLKNQV